MEKLVALILAPFLFIASFLGFNGSQEAASDHVSSEVSQQGSFQDVSFETADALLTVMPESGTFAVGSKIPVRIVFQPREKLLLSTGALRLEYSYEGILPIEIIDANLEKPGTQIAVNESLTGTESWSYLINTVTNDQENKKLIIDLAFAYINPEGFAVGEELVLAQFDVVAKERGSVDFVFAPQQSMMVTKDGTQLLLDLKSAQFLLQ